MLNFENASLVSYSHNSEFLGDSIFRYRITKQLSVDGYILDLTNSDGVSGIWSGISGFMSGANDYDAIMLNGVNFGPGKVNSINFKVGNDVRVKNYTADITIRDTGNLFNIDTTGSGSFYSGFNFLGWSLIDSITESFGFSRSDNSLDAYSHSVSLKCGSGSGVQPITLAKYIASVLFSGTNLQGFLGQQYTGLGLKKRHRESYNLITQQCSFEENVEFGKVSGVYSLDYTHSFNVDEDGIINVTENGNIKGIVDPLSAAAESGWVTEQPNVFGRCSGIFSAYAPTGAYPIYTYPVRKSLTINTFEGTISYNIGYTNDPKINDRYSWEYTNQLNRSDNGIYTVIENGKIVGLGRKLVEKYPNALSGWSGVSGGILGRITDLYTGNVPYPISPLKLISETNGMAEYEGSVTYGRSYTDDLTLQTGVPIKKIEYGVVDDEVVHLVNKFNILNFKEFIQPTEIGTLGKRAMSINMNGSRDAVLGDYLSGCKDIARNHIPSGKGSDVYMNSANYSLDKNNNAFKFDVSWTFHNYRAVEAISL